MATGCTADPAGLVAVPGAALQELAHVMDSLMQAVQLSQEDVSEQIRAEGTPDFDGPYHLVWCRAMRAIIGAEPLIRLGHSLTRLQPNGRQQGHPTPQLAPTPLEGGACRLSPDFVHDQVARKHNRPREKGGDATGLTTPGPNDMIRCTRSDINA